MSNSRLLKQFSIIKFENGSKIRRVLSGKQPNHKKYLASSFPIITISVAKAPRDGALLWRWRCLYITRIYVNVTASRFSFEIVCARRG